MNIERFKNWKDMSDEERKRLEIPAYDKLDFVKQINKCDCCEICSNDNSCDCDCEDCLYHSGISEAVKYHLDNKKPITENIFRAGSEAFFNLINECRQLFESGKIELLEVDKAIFETTDLGKTALYKGRLVQLDLPQFTEEYLKESAEYRGKKVELNKPRRNPGSGKKYQVYVRDPKTKNVKKVTFGDMKGGLSSKINDPDARKRYDSRHGCSAGKHEDKTKAGYWSCRLPRYAKMLGLAETSALWW
jgi:hypothetical protein